MRSWNRGPDRDIEAQLRSDAPEPSAELTRAISDRVRPRRSLMHGLSRVPLGVAGGLSAIAVTVALALGGGGAATGTAGDAANVQYEDEVVICIGEDVTITEDADTAAILVASGAATYGSCPDGEVVIEDN